MTGGRLQTSCTIEVSHTREAFHAHVALDGDLTMAPGDRVTVHGAPLRLAFGDTLVLRRPATVERAGLLRRLWTRVLSRLALCELYDVSFSSRRMP